MDLGRTFRIINAQVVFPTSVELTDVIIRDGRIDTSVPENFDGPSLDFEQDILIPGLVELHTDNLERHIEPRPGTFVPVNLALLAHDAELAAAGITTAFDALTLGGEVRDDARSFSLDFALTALAEAISAKTLRIGHHLHLRCELSDEALRERLISFSPPLEPSIVSLMDHTPGQGQYTDLDLFRRYYMRRYALDAEATEAVIVRRQKARAEHGRENRNAAIAFADSRRACLFTHDDGTSEDIRSAKKAGAVVVEFPTTEHAARAAKQAELCILAGAPNLLRGTSLSKNVAAADLVKCDALDILSSDYYPASLLAAVFLLERKFAIPLPQAVAMASKIPAETVGLSDRGAIANGFIADLIRVRATSRGPTVIAVWRAGERIF